MFAPCACCLGDGRDLRHAAPVTMRVVQMDPGPIPTLMASTPASISASAPSYVATLPASRPTCGNALLHLADRFKTRDECHAPSRSPETSARARTSSAARSRKSPVAPIAPPTRNRPWSSLLAMGYFSFFWMSLTVIRPSTRTDR